MEFNFSEAILALGAGAASRIANAARPAGSYLGNTLLPDRLRAGYNVKAGAMTVRATMAGLVGMDSQYPPGGLVESSKIEEGLAKIAIQNHLTEAAIRELQEMLRVLTGNAPAAKDRLATEALNFLQKVIVQPLVDTGEWLKWQALSRGLIDWAQNGIRLTVDYGVPAGNKFATRTDAANTAYFDTASTFWADLRAARRILRGGVRAIVMHPNTAYDIAYNPVNSGVVLSETPNLIRFQRRVGTQINAPTGDANDTVDFVLYGEEAEILNPADLANPTIVPFLSPGKVVIVGNNRTAGYRPGEGSTPDPLDALALGYTHVGPTVEGNGALGRWADLYTPQNEPWQLRGRGASNQLPVMEAPEKVVILTTEMAP